MFFQKRAAARSARSEPLRALSGQMRGRVITGQFTRAGRQVKFSFTLTKAAFAEGKLRLSGRFTAGRASDEVTATVAGVMARVANPRSAVASQIYRKGETQSENASPDPDGLVTPKSGCEIFFLSLTPSARLRNTLGSGDAVQLGVVVASFDNETGEEINLRICRILRSEPGSTDALAGVEQLNRLLSQGAH